MNADTEHDMDETGGAPEVAVIGMSGRFPGADDLDAFWRNLRDGVESIRTFSPDEMLAAGAHPDDLANPNWVAAGGPLSRDVVEGFDAAFFGYNPREAETLEPGHRLFLECCWEALENGGQDPARVAGNVGVFAGAGVPHYTDHHVRPRRELAATVGEFQLFVGSGKDFVATRTSYKLNLRGPSVSVQTGCSTSLVAIHTAAQSLLHGECDLALAGGANVVPATTGYMYAPGGISSPDGHCRAFDAEAAGTLVGSGVGAVLLKRLDDAVRDGDPIRAVIKGSAINNDGSLKVAFTAPSVEGQAAVIREALEVSDVDPETIRFVEGHGSGTDLGDPIEISALTQAFRSWTERRQFAAVGSVKTNVGHLDAAAGVAGFIKAVLAVENGQVPPTVHFQSPSAKIDFASSPFYVSGRLEPWGMDGVPRRAGVSSFGIGGTNAHVVIEQAPEPEASQSRRDTHLLVLSARTPSALDAATERLAAHLRDAPATSIADTAWTLQAGRREFAFRRMLVVRDGEDAAELLASRHPERMLTAAVEDGHRSVAFLFPGVGDQYPGMARGLYDAEPVFRAEVDRCADLLAPHLGLDLREVLFPAGSEPAASPAGGLDFRAMLAGKAEPDAAAERLNRTELAQPAVFVIEYALARMLMAWGIVPEAVIGHSLGEYAAACIAGIFTLEDALALVARRARLIADLPGGAMLAVPLSPEAVAPFLSDGVTVATVNAPALCVVAGTAAGVEAVRARLERAGHAARPLAATHAFHSPMMDAAVEPVQRLVAGFRLRRPRIPMASNVTGTWITDAEATDAGYWARHTREPVRFDRGMGEVLRGAGRVLVEVGPGQTLSTFVRQRADSGGVAVIPTLRYPYDRTADEGFLLGALGRLWLAGLTPDWAAFHDGERLRRIPLPTYPWERERYFIDPLRADEQEEERTVSGRRPNPAEWLYVPSWRRTAAPRPAVSSTAETVLLFADGDAVSAGVLAGLRAHGRTVTVVRPGAAFAPAEDGYTLRPASREDLRHLADAMGTDAAPRTVLYLWPLAGDGADRGLVGALAVADAFGRGAETAFVAVTSGAAEVASGDRVDPARAALLGGLAAVPGEYPAVTVRIVDVDHAAAESESDGRALGRRVAAEALAGTERLVALRGRHRWARAYESIRSGMTEVSPVRSGGAYLFIGGLRGRNGMLAEHLVRVHGARIAVIDPVLPHRGGWDAMVAARLPEDPTRGQIELIRRLEADGGNIVPIQAIPSELDHLHTAFRHIEEQFGTLHGIVFAPFGYDSADPVAVSEMRVAAWETRMGFLSAELRTVAQAIGDRVLDFVVVESSMAPVLGGVGVVDASAANAAVDAFAAGQAEAATPWTSAGWDKWSVEGSADYGIHAHEAATAFEHLLTVAGEPNVLIATGDPARRLEEAARAPRGGPASGGSYARPQLATEYHAPGNVVEQTIAEMWEELLGISPIGVHDDFFALGGHSLLATQIISRCRDTLGLELPLKTIFEAPTIARFAALVEDALVAEIEGMSDEEALALAGSA
ncbi:type I polyketide synthase [Longimicrobium terrae]|uniref:Phenolphthiocerol/phthiocerol polyketide synthase subunit E n=1 Tax=Longimicrobium terrae TaxID=1639882 RepID=A0A841H229_9BACT|nr:type I polyketide synthase [Longimicrobium terrae]MBB4637948.1 acyl transferase domain-containing protein/acyl carrier protein [Longimicrobium terrae]MBB6072195.1 acyl transferase domain-containing protein/acyl carrier protein [Longimicrobium terrae]NNC28379.1 acyltransferase domain-containing protein [Longimicrobium terrae]